MLPVVNLTYSSHHADQPISLISPIPFNTVDDLIEVEEVEDPSEDSEQGSAFGEEASSEDDSMGTSSAPNETEMTKDSLDERVTAIREGQYEHTS